MLTLKWNVVLFTLFLFDSCTPVEYDEIENLAAEINSNYEITNLETHDGIFKNAVRDEVNFTTVNDSTVIVNIAFTSFNSRNDFQIEGLELFQTGQHPRFDQKFDNATITVALVNERPTEQIYMNIDYDSDNFVHIEAEDRF